ncbi:glutathione S-transferase N-terminal domain-containing protein [Bradyrhizobium prioriisuperbiae]|uniref:glutathione S-transferase N-terminal domain-containing protein n=1 Tax=Bradyrhizobium prioriisuperbiae TaxID=2854389 RepID=UPI0028ECE42D|nr:glutathione S-transferase N-terminal domain-containing protein [Bradyrhizobium prioritasuperba]
MKLIGTYVSPYARRVAAALVSRAIAYEHDDLNGYANAARARELNPVGKVPILELDDGERLFDSAAIIDYLDELVGPEHALMPRSGSARRHVLRLSAVANTICELVTVRYLEQQRPAGCSQPQLLERCRLQIVGGFKALDAASGCSDAIRLDSLNIATISAIVAFEYTPRWYPGFDPAEAAPSLAKVVSALHDDAAFARTRPLA